MEENDAEGDELNTILHTENPKVLNNILYTYSYFHCEYFQSQAEYSNMSLVTGPTAQDIITHEKTWKRH
jgi:hypothetical protein